MNLTDNQAHYLPALNLLLSSSAEEFGLHDDRLLRELSLAQNFVVA